MSDRPDHKSDDEPARADRAASAHGDDDDDDDALDDPYADDVRGELRDDATSGKERGFTTKVIGDLAKRALMTGIGAVFMSEESLKHQLSEMKLPKEAMSYVVGQADRTKKEIVGVIARETRDFLSKLEMDKVLARVLAGTTIEIQTRIKILPKEGGGIQTSVEEHSTSLGKSADKEAPEQGEDAERPKRKRRRQDEL